MGESRTPIEVRVRLFGPEARCAGASEVLVELEEGGSAGDVVGAVERACAPLRGRMEHCRVAVNHEFAAAEAPIGAGDEVALIGLVSGG